MSADILSLIFQRKAMRGRMLLAALLSYLQELTFGMSLSRVCVGWRDADIHISALQKWQTRGKAIQ